MRDEILEEYVWLEVRCESDACIREMVSKGVLKRCERVASISDRR